MTIKMNKPPPKDEVKITIKKPPPKDAGPPASPTMGLTGVLGGILACILG